MNSVFSRCLISAALFATAACKHSEPVAPAASASTPEQASAPVAPVHHTWTEQQSLPVAPLRTQITAEELTALCAKAQVDANEHFAAIAAVPASQRTFGNTFNAYEQTLADFNDATGRLAFLKDIHPDAKVREAAAKCEGASGKYSVQVTARKDLYQALHGFTDNAQNVASLDAQDKRLIEFALRDFRRNGLALPDDKRQQLVKVREQLAEISTKFESNLDENNDSIEVTAADLKGMPKAFVDRLKKAKDGKLILTTKYPDYYPVMDGCKVEKTRLRLEQAFGSRELDHNMPLLVQGVQLRDQAARLLGYPTHADYVTETRMAKDAATVTNFLSRIQKELKPGRDRLLAQLTELKRKETHDKKAVLGWQDLRYYLNELKQRDFKVDDELVRGYFPADKVLAGMLQVYSQLLGVTFKEVKDATVWAPGVSLYEIHDAASNRLLAEFYLDLFPREGKYGHAASFPLSSARERPNGYQIPLSALVTNFSPPANGKVSHLTEEEVTVLFHEFGHIIHQSLTTARFASMAGANTATDFVEAPSQMLESWVYQPAVLKVISEDPKDPSKPMPEELAQRLAKARTFSAPLMYSRQAFFAAFDMTLHTSGPNVDPDAVANQLIEPIVGIKPLPNWHIGPVFGHLFGGYDAGYYGYLWSQVFAEDMFTRFAKEGVLNTKTGREYRDDILARGRSEDEGAMLKHFLGREPDEHAFLRRMNVEPPLPSSPPPASSDAAPAVK